MLELDINSIIGLIEGYSSQIVIIYSLSLSQISNITYLRTIFPEHAFGNRCLEDLSLKILRDDSACPGACQVIKW